METEGTIKITKVPKIFCKIVDIVSQPEAERSRSPAILDAGNSGVGEGVRISLLPIHLKLSLNHDP